jgi:hypothetical protein
MQPKDPTSLHSRYPQCTYGPLTVLAPATRLLPTLSHLSSIEERNPSGAPANP